MLGLSAGVRRLVGKESKASVRAASVGVRVADEKGIVEGGARPKIERGKF